MDLDQVLDSLQYRGSPNFLSGKALESDRDFGHVFRKAQQAECNLRGAYVLNAGAYNLASRECTGRLHLRGEIGN